MATVVGSGMQVLEHVDCLQEEPRDRGKTMHLRMRPGREGEGERKTVELGGCQKRDAAE